MTAAQCPLQSQSSLSVARADTGRTNCCCVCIVTLANLRALQGSLILFLSAQVSDLVGPRRFHARVALIKLSLFCLCIPRLYHHSSASHFGSHLRPAHFVPSARHVQSGETHCKAPAVRQLAASSRDKPVSVLAI